jgi:hypothetical protein
MIGIAAGSGWMNSRIVSPSDLWSTKAAEGDSFLQGVAASSQLWLWGNNSRKAHPAVGYAGAEDRTKD